MFDVSLRLALSVVLAAALLGTVQAPGQTDSPQQPVSLGSLSIPQLEAAAVQARAAGRNSDAIRLLQIILSKDRSNKEALGMLGDTYWDVGDPGKARKFWLAVLDIQPDDFDANFGLGRLHLNTENYRSAVEYLSRAEKVAPADKLVDVLVPLAQAYGPLAQYEEAFDAIKRAVAIDPDNFEAQYALVGIAAVSATDGEDYDRADTEAQRLVDLAEKKLRTEGVTRQGVQNEYTAYEMRLSVLRGYQNVLFEKNADGTISNRPLPDSSARLAGVVSRVVETMLNREDTRRTMAYFEILELARQAVEFDGGSNKKTLTTLARLQERTGDIAGAVASYARVLKLDPGADSAKQALERLGQTPPPTGAPTP